MDNETPPLAVPTELIVALEEMIPEKCPDLSTPDREIWHYRGMRQVVLLLRRHHNERTQHSNV